MKIDMFGKNEGLEDDFPFFSATFSGRFHINFQMMRDNPPQLSLKPRMKKGQLLLFKVMSEQLPVKVFFTTGVPEKNATLAIV